MTGGCLWDHSRGGTGAKPPGANGKSPPETRSEAAVTMRVANSITSSGSRAACFLEAHVFLFRDGAFAGNSGGETPEAHAGYWLDTGRGLLGWRAGGWVLARQALVI